MHKERCEAPPTHVYRIKKSYQAPQYKITQHESICRRDVELSLHIGNVNQNFWIFLKTKFLDTNLKHKHFDIKREYFLSKSYEQFWLWYHMLKINIKFPIIKCGSWNQIPIEIQNQIFSPFMKHQQNTCISLNKNINWKLNQLKHYNHYIFKLSINKYICMKIDTNWHWYH